MVTRQRRVYGEAHSLNVGGTVILYAIFGLAGLALARWLVRSPVLRAILRGRGTDPGQFGTWQDHLEDNGLGPSWRSDGSGGRRETHIYSKHTRRR